MWQLLLVTDKTQRCSACMTSPCPIHTHTCSDLLQATRHIGSVIFQTVPQGKKNNPLGDVSDLNHRTAGCFLHKVVTIEYILKCWPMYLFKVRLLSEQHWFVVFVLPALHILLTPSPMSSVLYKYTEASLCASLPLEPAASRDLVSVVSAVKARAPPRRLQGSPLQPLQEHGPETKHTSENA